MYIVLGFPREPTEYTDLQKHLSWGNRSHACGGWDLHSLQGGELTEPVLQFQFKPKILRTKEANGKNPSVSLKTWELEDP